MNLDTFFRKFESARKSFNSNQLNTVINLIDMKVDEENKPILQELKQLEKQFNVLQWMIGIGFTVVTVILAVLALK